ncbi:leucine-rich repeat domain-containing protein [Candidatus Palauibacter sp.]|uniref:leucine-rich repeat domain-containing protein n=1 Tax=Candidatus Palauibacter sp. TaxID=3101350 RepID=UPI003B02B9A0
MRVRPLALAATLGALVAALSCDGRTTSGPAAPAPSLVPASVSLEPAEVTVEAGDTVRLKATVYNDRAQPISDAVVTWASGDPTVATVDTTGLVTGVKGGSTSLTVTSGPAATTAPVTVQSQDRATLIDLHDATSGGDWTQSENWVSDEPIGSWYGVSVNAESRVTAIDLSGNGLKGRLPENLGNLAFLTDLRVNGNAELSGPIPVSLSELGIRTLQYGGTKLCTVRDEEFQAWLNAIPTREGEFVACNEDRADLMKLYEAMGGEGWTNATKWGTDAPLGEWTGVAVDPRTGRVAGINLSRNNLTGRIPPEIRSIRQLEFLRLDNNDLEGEIPPEIGDLPELVRLDLDGNRLTGRIPPEIGNLRKLRTLWLGGDGLTGPIPPELGKLSRLEALHLYKAGFEGSIPPELGSLTRLRVLEISDTGIAGPIPEALGGLRSLRELHLTRNRLTGPLPESLGRLTSLGLLILVDNEIDGPLPETFGFARSLYRVWLQDNPGLSGPLPESMTRLDRIFELRAERTGLCMPRTPTFRAWLESSLPRYRIRFCGAEAHAEAYLTQAAQSRDFPVPLVAGEGALLRVFVTSEEETGATMPPVRATLFLDGAEVHVADIPAGSSAIPAEVREGELDLSANALIPAEVIQPGLEMVVEVDPDGTVDSNLGVAKRIPATGRMEVDVRVVPPMRLTLLPIILAADNDESAAEFASTAEADDEIFWQTRNLLPVADFELAKHEPVIIDRSDIVALLRDVARIRIIEEGVGHWIGLIASPLGSSGAAFNPYYVSRRVHAKASVSVVNAETIAHELGHNFSLLHAGCGNPTLVDPAFPHSAGRTGVWGYDPRNGGSLVPPDRAELMSYCDPTWISDYFFTNALRFRRQDPLEIQGARVPRTGLLVSGDAAADGTLRLDPVFVVEAPPALPETSGPYALTGRRADASELFSLSFDMTEVADVDGRSAFTFVLPVEAAWQSELVSLELSGPDGVVEVREGSAPPMAIMRDPATGRVRAILGNLPPGPLARSVAEARAPEPGLDIMVSSGLPGAEAWPR